MGNSASKVVEVEEIDYEGLAMLLKGFGKMAATVTGVVSYCVPRGRFLFLLCSLHVYQFEKG